MIGSLDETTVLMKNQNAIYFRCRWLQRRDKINLQQVEKESRNEDERVYRTAVGVFIMLSLLRVAT